MTDKRHVVPLTNACLCVLGETASVGPGKPQFGNLSAGCRVRSGSNWMRLCGVVLGRAVGSLSVGQWCYRLVRELEGRGVTVKIGAAGRQREMSLCAWGTLWAASFYRHRGPCSEGGWLQRGWHEALGWSLAEVVVSES